MKKLFSYKIKFILILISCTGCFVNNTKPENKKIVNIVNTSENSSTLPIDLLPQKSPSSFKKVTSVEISHENINIEINKSTSLYASVKIESGEQNSAVEWISSDNSIVTVNSSGIVNALKGGSTIIKAVSIQDKNIFDECKVTVIDPESDKPTVIDINSATGEKIVFEKETLRLNGVVKYVNGKSDSYISWKSSDESIATITPDGIVYGIKKGIVTISAVSNMNNSVKSDIELNVNEKVVNFPFPVNSPVSQNNYVSANFNLKYSDSTTSGFKLSWRTFPDVKSYDVYISNKLSDSLTESSLTVSGKLPAKRYPVKIIALTNKGQKVYSETINTYTKMNDEILSPDSFSEGNGIGNWSLGWTPKSAPENFFLYTKNFYLSPFLWWSKYGISDKLPVNMDLPHPNVTLNLKNEKQVSGLVSLSGKQLSISPGPDGELSVVRFTAPVPGKYSFSVRFGSAFKYTSSDVHVIVKGENLFTGYLHPSVLDGIKAETPDEALYSNQINLLEGETIDFTAGIGYEDYAGDSTTIDVTIKQTE